MTFEEVSHLVLSLFLPLLVVAMSLRLALKFIFC